MQSSRLESPVLIFSNGQKTVRNLEGYKRGTSSPTSSCSFSHSQEHSAEPPNLQDLHLQPSKVPDLWRIEGGGLDLHLHRSDLHFHLTSLRAPCSRVPLGTLGFDLVNKFVSLVVVDSLLVIGILQLWRTTSNLL